tara:strand:+ start:18752 stop:19318 length:567 start_codon:yes stop_codon:yes gene_type:complete
MANNNTSGGFLYNGQGKRSLARPRRKPVHNCYVNYKNITGSTASNFFANSDYFEFIESVLITNTHASDSVTIDLYEFKGQRIISSNESSSDTADLGGDTEGLRTAIVNPDEDIASDSNINYSKPLSELNVIGDLTFYILKSVKIPKGASLLLDSNDLSYKNAPDNGTLFIKLDQSDSQVTVRTIEKLK